MDWEQLKETLHLWYARAAQLFLLQNLVLYILACIASGHPVSVGKYAAFVDHLFTFR